MEFLKKIKDKAPEYDIKHEELILKFTVGQGGRSGTASEETAFEQGKQFSSKYETYMYSTLLGLKANYPLPFSDSSKKTSFMYMKLWQHQDLVDYILMGIFAKGDFDFLELEKKDDNEIEGEILKIRKLMEEYANGGFDIIRGKLESEPTFFENNDNCFLDLLEDIKIK